MGQVLFETGDGLSEEAIATALARRNATDYVERGLAFSNLTSSEFEVSSGIAFLNHNNGRFTLELDTQTVVLATQTGVNLIYATFDPGVDDSQDIVAAESAGDVSDPKLKIGEVDAGQSTLDDTINRDPDGTFVDLIADRVADELAIQDLVDDSSGAKVYDSATETLGDGTQSGDLESLSTVDLSNDKQSNASNDIGTVWASHYSDINAAIQDLPANGGRVVIDDLFTIDYKIEIDRHLVFTAPSKAHPQLNPTHGVIAGSGFPSSGGMFDFTSTDRYTMFNGLVINGNDGNAQRLINGSNTRYVTIKSCFLEGSSQSAIYLDGGYGTRIGGFTTVEFINGDVDLIYVAGQDRVQINGLYTTNDGTGRDSLVLENCTNSTVSNVYLHNSGRSALYLNGCDRFDVNVQAYLGGKNTGLTGGQFIHFDNTSNGRISVSAHCDADSIDSVNIGSGCSNIHLDGVAGNQPISNAGTNTDTSNLVSY